MSITPFFHVYHKYVFNMANINKIKLSGTTYNIQDENATKTVELTQAQYDALAVKDPNTFYIITDATGADLSNYYTKSETSGATQISTALASKQTTLTAGTNITIVDNVISATGGGGGGGKAVSAGTNISITTGETADTINCTVPYAGEPNYTITYGYAVSNGSQHSLVIGAFCSTPSNTQNNIVVGFDCHSMEGHNAAFGFGNYSNNRGELSSGYYNISNSGSTNADKTLFSVGNGTSNSARHNAFEIRQNGDIYLTKDGQDVKLQDQLGGSSYTAGDGIDLTNDVISVTGKVDTSAITTSITSANTNTQVPSAKAVYDQLGGLKLVKLTQAQYDALSTKDSNTLYIIEEAPECNTPQGATYHAVDDNFDKTTQVYGIDFSNYDALNNEPTTFTVDLNSANNIEYTVDVNTNNAEPYFTTTVTRGTETVYTADVAGFNFCEVFGEPMYISAFPSYEQCVDEQCTEYECVQWDEETGECIEQGDCISTECIETQTNYPMTALY